MERCYFSKKYTTEKTSVGILVFFCSIVLIFLGVYIWTYPGSCILILIAALLVSNYVFVYWVFSREYELTEQGIVIQYWGKKQSFSPWTHVTTICICTIHKGKVDGVETDVIWCTLGKVRHEPPENKRCVNEADYEVKHYRSILTVEFTPERLAEFERYSKREIPDYRNSK